MCLKLSLLNLPHYFHSTRTNCPFFLIVQVDFIMNSCLWIHPSPILELQHALLPPKCCELESITQFSYFSVVSFWDPHLGHLRSLGARKLGSLLTTLENWFSSLLFFNLVNVSFSWCLKLVFGLFPCFCLNFGCTHSRHKM